tara:strand:+ start:7501 stop:8082 length:582 start_codon:yes stop_codon:yes gene_type:complete
MAERDQTFLDKLKNALRRGRGEPSTRNASQWFRRKVGALRSELRGRFSEVDTAEEFYSTAKKSGRNTIAPGKMAAYFYDPKTKQKLKYYDRFPLIMCVKMYNNGFLGLNFHYLPPLLRARLMDAIDRSKSINYEALARIKEVKPTVKRYLYKHITSKVVIVDDDEKEIALFLPTERFKKEDKLIVWGDSRRMI